MCALSEEQIQPLLKTVPEWERMGTAIVRTFVFKNFREAVAFVVHVGILAEQMDHHPDIDIRYKVVTLGLATHVVGGLTEKDFELAQKIDKIL